jgi:phytoene desaturase
MIKPSQKVVIVGAGPGGLAAAMLLARSGVDVTVVERREVVGGRTSTMERRGFKFDTGPTFFLYPKVLREIFSVAGRNLDEEIPMYRLDPQYRLVFGSGGELLATPDLQRMERAIARLSPHDARGFHRFFYDNRNKFERFTPFLESPFESWKDLARLDMLKLLPLLRPWRSLDSDLRSYFKD